MTADITSRIGTKERATAWGLLAIGVGVAVAGGFLGWSKPFPGFDELIHFYNTFAVTLVLALYLYGSALMGASEHSRALVAAVLLIGLGLGALWEIAEFAYDHLFGQRSAIQGKLDTIIDLIMDTIGALVAGIVAAAMAKR